METFTARIKKVWIMRCVDVPAAVMRRLGGDGIGKNKSPRKNARIPVLAHYLGQTLENTIVPGGRGLGRMTLHMKVLRPAGLDVGDTLEISLEPDRVSREPEVPPDLARALAVRSLARKGWERMTPAGRRQVVLYLDRAKTEATREKYVERFLERLSEEESAREFVSPF
ncbi:MAG: YdeI/OmpD-associated family protein [Verrucomicrobia bacterium]|nr:YdeI/OmpD-associated family protein [Verrucomicrobiota bacterium]MBV9657627.1 YdeI/OmpD-associated family protein [Verrucomicrobiota bacterium]